MRKIVYYVASSLDGFISGPNEDVSGFPASGNGVDQYLADLAHFDTVIMGRRTYEFGYNYGMKPGQLAYPHMRHYIFSNTLKLENPDPRLEVKAIDLDEITKLQNEEGSEIYLCGGGQFAGWLLENQKIDILKVKLNPLILGDGIRMFGESSKKYQIQLLDTKLYDKGLQIITYQIDYGASF